MRFYEDYEQAYDKRQACKGATRGKATGKALSYLVVFHENGFNGRGFLDCRSALFTGAIINQSAPEVCGATCSPDYVRSRCRRIAKREVPAAWLKALIGGDE